eukprot:scaffold3818_cov260-Chaetoceros_neogracile.AAC.3
MISSISPILRSRAALSRVSYQGIRFHAARSMSSVVTLSDEDAVEKFKTINEKSILYFTASWCPPCKMIKPIYESMAKDHPELSFGKVDIDDNAEAAAKYEISGVPTFILIDKEKIFSRFSGADQNQLELSVSALKEA